MKQTETSVKSSRGKKPWIKNLQEMHWLERAGVHIFFAGFGLIGASFYTAGISEQNEKFSHLMALFGLGLNILGLILWATTALLTKGSRNV